MNDLEMCKKIAELEFGSLLNESVVESGNKLLLLSEMGNLMFEGDDIDYPLEFNPITDLALSCMLRDKYEVEVNYVMAKHVAIYCVNADGLANIESINFESKEDIPRAVCECILKSKGLWDE
jgi:hypothetical protein